MTLSQIAGGLWPRLSRRMARGADEWNRVGEQMVVYARTLRHIPVALTKYRTETMRVLAESSLGVGGLAAVGGAMMVVAFLVANGGAVIGVIGHAQLGDIGLDALGGFFSAFGNTRLPAPVIAIVGLSATVGAGATAQIGAMRINEEIDALEVMGISAITYLASTRVVAGMIAVVPIFFTALVGAYLASRTVLVNIYGQSGGVYDHYFNTFLNPFDVIWATVQVVVGAMAVMLIHTYYGLTASGGPAGVGEATGRAVRTSMIVAVFLILGVSLILYGRSGNFHLSG